ncbi:MAG: hypothetical protein RMM06_06060, partial [Armatimonadota bacterium]|nr:hypothetical protein [Armatimonadota bacterium]
MKRFVLFGLVAGLALLVNSAWALTPNFSTWQSWGVADLNEDGVPYWDGNSSDYNPQPANIGNWLTKTGAFAPGGLASPAEKAASPGVAYPYLGTSSGGAYVDVYFTTTLPGVAALKIEIAGLSA